MEGRFVVVALKVIAWLKYPLVLMMAFVLVRPPVAKPEHTEMLTEIAAQSSITAMLASNSRDLERQADVNEADIKSIQRRLDLLEAMRIDASLSALKATIDYDHALLMTIAGMMVLMVIGSGLNHLKKKTPI